MASTNKYIYFIKITNIEGKYYLILLKIKKREEKQDIKTNLFYEMIILLFKNATISE